MIFSYLFEILEKVENYLRLGSGWVVDSALSINLHVSDYTPMVIGSHIALPEELAKKSSLLNIRNQTDELCIAWCLAASRVIARRKQEAKDSGSKYKALPSGYRTHHYRDEMSKINLEGVNFPVTDKDVSTIRSLSS